MSWDAALYSVTEVRDCPHCGHPLPQPRREEAEIGWWNFTHNTNRMIREAADPDWWDSLNGLPGAEGKALLERIITGLEADPERYRAMNPPNGWGDYGTLLKVLREMRGAVPADEVTVWSVSG